MIFFLYGSDNYRLVSRRRELVSELKKKYPDLTIGKFSFAEEKDFGGFLDFARGQSLFSAKRLAILDDIEEMESKRAGETLIPFLEKNDVAVIVSLRGKPAKDLGFLLAKPSFPEEFTELSHENYMEFAGDIAKKRGANISVGALNLLAQIYAKNSWGLVTEIQKLSCSGKKIGEKEIVEFGLETKADYWQLLNSLKSQNIGSRLYALFSLSSGADQPAKAFNILASTNKPKAAMFAAYDALIKSGKLDYEEALLDFAIA